MSKNGIKYMQLLDSLDLLAHIQCSKCGKEDYMDSYDEYQSMKQFYSEGWRATELNTYCPKCAKKYLKPKNKKS